MAKYEIELSDVEVKAMLSDVSDIQEWLQNAARMKARQCIDACVEASGRGSRFTDQSAKEAIISDLDIETAAERTGRLQEEIRQREAM